MNGKRLRRLRQEKKITQSQLGKIINVSKVSISGYETGERVPDTDNLKRLADFFGVTTDYLLGRSDDPRLTADQEKDAFDEFKELKELISPLSEENKKKVLQRLVDFTKGAVDENK